MSHQRLSVPTLVTVIVAVVTMALLFAPGRPAQSGRRPSARMSRTALRLDAADPASYDTDHHDPASAVAAGVVVEQPALQLAPGPARVVSRREQSAHGFAVSTEPLLVNRDRRAGEHVPGAAVLPPARVSVPVTGRAPPTA